MSRGFQVTVSVPDSEGLSTADERFSAELTASGPLSELEADVLVPAAIAGAKAIVDELKGPFTVTLRGVDHTYEADGKTAVEVLVVSAYTAGVDGVPTEDADSSDDSAVTTPDSTQVDSAGDTESAPSASVPDSVGGEDESGGIADGDSQEANPDQPSA